MATLSDPVGRLALTRGAARVFQRHGIDYCCGGDRTLDEACATAHADPQRILGELESQSRMKAPESILTDLTVSALIDRILVRYHATLRVELPYLRILATTVAAAHGARHPALLEVKALLISLASEAELHMQKEETILFPWIIAGAGSSAGAPIACLREEHEHHGHQLRRLRELTDGYRAPEEACASWEMLCRKLEDLERELMEHIGLENNLLFPRALGR
jgi:regulator of cell morphogenesis and NO signaling